MPCASNVRRVQPFQEIARVARLIPPKNIGMEPEPGADRYCRDGGIPTFCYGSVMASELRNHARRHPQAGGENTQDDSGTGEVKRPFDTSGMNWVPDPEQDDPPYRDWWVVDDKRNGE